MAHKYSFLNDPRALAEIRKHKWIESQKQGSEVGFASAAVDWIRKYGKAWKQIHQEGPGHQDVYLERRRYRRFKMRGHVRLMGGDGTILAEPLDMSFSGILCRVSESVPPGTPMRVLFSSEARPPEETLDCCGKVERIVSVDTKRFDLFFSFNDGCQRMFPSVLTEQE